MEPDSTVRKTIIRATPRRVGMESDACARPFPLLFDTSLQDSTQRK